jgi:hypothetical protein
VAADQAGVGVGVFKDPIGFTNDVAFDAPKASKPKPRRPSA